MTLFTPKSHASYGHIIGIDPDLKKSGVALWCRQGKGSLLTLKLMTFRELIRFAMLNQVLPGGILVRIEAGWLNEISNYHAIKLPEHLKQNPEAAARYRSKAAQRVAKNVGENHAAGKLIAEWLQQEGIDVEFVKPIKTKWTPQKLKAITGVEVKNQEPIDAASLVVGC